MFYISFKIIMHNIYVNINYRNKMFYNCIVYTNNQMKLNYEHLPLKSI